MCEVLAVSWDRPEPLRRILPWALRLERVGIAGHGWGVAWLDRESGAVRGYRRPTSLADDLEGAEAIAGVRSTRFLLHLRRPTRLSTVQLADTQPFVGAAVEGRPGTFAFCHNGFLERHEELRPRYAGRLRGRADSEVGLCLLVDLLAECRSPKEALPEIHRRLGGSANFGYLGRDGELLVYGGHPANAFRRFGLEGADVAATEAHSPDDALFDVVFEQAVDRRTVTEGVSVVGPAERGSDRGDAPAIREAAG
jgi:hypothetical protein